MATKKQERANDIVVRTKEMYPKAKCALDFTNAFELLIATILSAQSTDVRVNIVTKSLFRKYPGPAEFAKASQPEMEKDVRQTGYVVLSNAFKTPAGIVVDTHVTRVSGRLGLTANSEAEKIEQDLMQLI